MSTEGHTLCDFIYVACLEKANPYLMRIDGLIGLEDWEENGKGPLMVIGIFFLDNENV